MDYRLAKLEELPQLARMRWALWLEDGQAPAQQDQRVFMESFVAWLEPRFLSSWFVWCAVDDDAVVSHIYIQRIEKLPKPSAPEDAFGYLTNVYTKPAFRNRGIGAALLQHVAPWALAANLEFLVLWPSETSTPFWTRAGFSDNASLLREIRPYLN